MRGISGDERRLLFRAPAFQLALPTKRLIERRRVFLVDEMNREPRGGIRRALAPAMPAQPLLEVTGVTDVERVVSASEDIHPHSNDDGIVRRYGATIRLATSDNARPAMSERD